MILDLAHLAFRVRDLQAALDFYALLGIHEAFRLHHPDGSLMLVYLHIGGDRFLELFPAETDEAPAPSAGFGPPVGFFHLCLRTDNLHGEVEKLRAQGLQIEIEPTLGLDHNWQAWIRDPEGHLIELMELSEDSPQRRVARGVKPTL